MKRLFKKKAPKQSDNTTLLIQKQSERIEQLRQENLSLTKQIENYRKQEKEIAETLDFSRKQQENYLNELKIRYTLENERLRRFCEKLESYHSKEELIKGYDESFASLRKTRLELERVLKEDLGEGCEEYLSERSRLGEEENPYEISEPEQTNLIGTLSQEELDELLEQI